MSQLPSPNYSVWSVLISLYFGFKLCIWEKDIRVISHNIHQMKNFGRLCRSLQFNGGHMADLPQGVSRCFLKKKRRERERSLHCISDLSEASSGTCGLLGKKLGMEGHGPRPVLSSAAPRLPLCPKWVAEGG